MKYIYNADQTSAVAMSLKWFVKRTLLRFNIIRNILQWYSRKHCPVFMYHRFSKKAGEPGINALDFTLQLDEIKRSFTVLPLSEFCRQRSQGRSDWRRTCVITIDDGYRDFHQIAYPLLRERGLPATLFITTGFLNQTTWLWWDIIEYIFSSTSIDSITLEYNGRVQQLDFKTDCSRRESWKHFATLCAKVSNSEKWTIIQTLAERLKVPVPAYPPDKYQACTVSELEEMAENGITFGPHTGNHPILSRCEEWEWKGEILDSRKHLSVLSGGYIDIFAYPGGKRSEYNEFMASFLKSYGFEAALVAHYDDFNNETQFTIRRCTASGDTVEFLWTLWGGEYIMASSREMLTGLIKKSGVTKYVKRQWRCPEDQTIL